METRNVFWSVWLALFSWCLLKMNRAQAFPQEAQILRLMKSSLEDPHLSMRNWEDSIDAPCNWDGITCDNSTEYGYSLRVTEKSDVYSFGVVLLELVTGKQPIEPGFGENKDIVYWVSQKLYSQEHAFELLDSRISRSFKQEMSKVLKIAVDCTHALSALRPTMREVVQMMVDADPCSGNFGAVEQGKAP